MPNHVTNRLEIIADNETVQKVMNFLKGVNEEDGTPCHIDFNKIIPMPKELLIEASSSGKLGMEYLTAMQRKPLYTQDDLATVHPCRFPLYRPYKQIPQHIPQRWLRYSLFDNRNIVSQTVFQQSCSFYFPSFTASRNVFAGLNAGTE